MAVPAISSRVGSAHPNTLLALIPDLISHTFKNFQDGLNLFSGGLSPPWPTPGAATNAQHPLLGIFLFLFYQTFLSYVFLSWSVDELNGMNEHLVSIFDKTMHLEY